MNNIILGDCFIEMEKLISEDVKVDTIVCDPPYNIAFEGNEWDKDFNISLAIDLCSKLIKENGNIILFQGWSNVCETKQIMDKYWNIQNWIVWDRIKGRGAKTNLVSTREDILWYCNGDSPTFNKLYSNIPKKTGGLGTKNGQENRALTNVWYDISPIVPWSDERNVHPTQKPLELMTRIINMFTNKGDLVLDFTAGSGTTILACQKLDRNYIGIEKDETFYNLMKERIKNEKIKKKLF